MVRERSAKQVKVENHGQHMNDRRKRLNKKKTSVTDPSKSLLCRFAWDRSLPSCHQKPLVTSPSNSAAGGEVVACSESCLMLKLGNPGHCALCFLPADRDEDEWFHFVGSFAIGFCLPCHRRSQVDSLWKRKSRLCTKVKQS